ncbi:MAG: diphthamide biosynthesis enzyme Dph2 [Candidatus Thermoplasmatota archaeon]|nr:diphthamide biosynthesis enzyme Dph2 [Candidatus Thermoplasmatota archaeon]
MGKKYSKDADLPPPFRKGSSHQYDKIFGSYRIDTSEIDSKLQDKSIKNVFVQLPEGLQQYAIEIKDWFEKTYEIIIVLDALPNYGACDLPSEQILQQLEVHAVIQIGHLPIPSMNVDQFTIPIFFVNAKSTLSVSSVVNKSISKLSGTHIGLISTAQHLHQIDEIKDLLEKNSFSVVIGTGDNRLFFPGQVLGCNFTTATSIADEIDSFLFVGTGFFHPLGLLLATDKPVVIADPYTNQVIDSASLKEKKQQLLRQRYGAIAFAKQAKIIGVLLGLKPGQMRNDYALKLHELIQNAGKQCLLLATDIVTPNLVDRFPHIDVFVSTACPRIAIDDYTSFKKPILTPIELEVALQQKDWDEYVFDEIYG